MVKLFFNALFSFSKSVLDLSTLIFSPPLSNFFILLFAYSYLVSDCCRMDWLGSRLEVKFPFRAFVESSLLNNNCGGERRKAGLSRGRGWAAIRQRLQLSESPGPTGRAKAEMVYQSFLSFIEWPRPLYLHIDQLSVLGCLWNGSMTLWRRLSSPWPVPGLTGMTLPAVGEETLPSWRGILVAHHSAHKKTKLVQLFLLAKKAKPILPRKFNDFFAWPRALDNTMIYDMKNLL